MQTQFMPLKLSRLASRPPLASRHPGFADDLLIFINEADLELVTAVGGAAGAFYAYTVLAAPPPGKARPVGIYEMFEVWVLPSGLEPGHALVYGPEAAPPEPDWAADLIEVGTFPVPRVKLF
jgi:hypothetical protein